MNEQPVFDLSKFDDFIFNALRSTDEVKNILQNQCEEAKFALAPWRLETITRKEVDQNSCTCIGILSSEDHVKDIANGIENAVAQARKLREKLAANIAEEKKLARRPSVREIYAPSTTEIGSKTQLVKSKMGKENDAKVVVDKSNSNETDKTVMKKNEIRKSGQKIQGVDSCLENNPKFSKAKGKSEGKNVLIQENRRSCLKSGKNSEPKRIRDNKLVGISPYNSLAAASKIDVKTKSKKNFIAANKSSIKKIKSSKSPAESNSRNQASKNSIHDSESLSATKSSDSLITRAPSSTVEFENLISKISLDVENGMTMPGANMADGNGCPLHDKNAPKFAEEKIYTSVDVAEGLDRFGVPPELVKILKVYHSYLKSRSIPKPSNNRGEKAANRFLQEFDMMNRARRQESNREKLDDLCSGFLPAYKESWNNKMDFIESSKLKIRYTDLDSACKSLGIRSNSPTKRKISNTSENRRVQSYSEGNFSWKSNSVWNEACIPNLEVLGMSRARCIRYANKNQLLELSGLIQRFQQLKYQSSLVDLLINEVLPSVRNSLEPTSEEYAAVYKMMSIISNLLYLKVPVLVRTDK